MQDQYIIADKKRGRKPTPISQRFWPKVNVTSEDECWIWIGATDKKGYGKITAEGNRWRFVPAHRVSYMLAHGHIPEGLLVRHSCDNPPCVNPKHLLLGTVQDNIRDKVTRHRHPCGDRHGMRLHPECVVRGERHYQAKLTEQDVRAIRNTFAGGCASMTKLARIYGVSTANVSCIIHRRKWAHVA
jgi:hypothetical protein